MSRSRRNPPGGHIYHVLNRANRRATLFRTDKDYRALLNVIREALLLVPVRLIEYCIMPNHWHLVLWPLLDGQLAAFMHYLTTTHATRWNLFQGLSGTGHVYQGPYKFFPVENDDHAYRLSRYVVRNAKRANLVEQAEDWPWCSLHARQTSSPDLLLLSQPPLAYPSNWIELVNQPQSEEELAAIRRSVRHDYPYGGSEWTDQVAPAFGFTNAPGQRGRPPSAT